MAWVLPVLMGASIIVPPIIDWVGSQTWNKQQADDNHALAEAAKYDMSQRQSSGVNPYSNSAPLVQQTTVPTNPFSNMMPMMMMMMMIPLMANMARSQAEEQ